jgi:hypothetical protein
MRFGFLIKVFPVVVPSSHRARRVKVEASCCANLDAPARDAIWTRQRRPLRASGETECRHVQAEVAIPALQRPARRSPAPVHRPVRSQRRQPASRAARYGRHALRPAVRRVQSAGAAGRRSRVTATRARVAPAPGWHLQAFPCAIDCEGIRFHCSGLFRVTIYFSIHG